jgi:ABC-type transport system involved in cytochrome bd biosynthesis fused ATPase/permease subunit
MEDGRIVEQGKHDMLLQQDGTYTGLYEAQFKKLLEDERGCESETAI